MNNSDATTMEPAVTESADEETPFSRIQAAVSQGKPWPADLSDVLLGCAPNEVLQVIRETRLRQVIQGEDGPSFSSLYKSQLKGGPREAVTPAQQLTALRHQFEWFISLQSDRTRTRLRHLYQTQAQPQVLRNGINRFMAVTFIPGNRFETFPVDQQFVELKYITAATVNLRPHRVSQGGQDPFVMMMPDIKLHEFEVDTESGLIRVGGAGTGTDGRAFSRCKLAKHFSYPSFIGADKKIVNENRSLTEAGIAMHQGMEDAAVHANTVRNAPTFPRIYFGFPDPGTVDVELTPAIEIDTFQALDRWFRSGRRTGNPFGEWIGDTMSNDGTVANILRKVQQPARTWGDFVRQLGAEDAEYMLICNRMAHTYFHDNLYLIPADYFLPYSEQRPAWKSVKVYGEMTERLRGRRVYRNIDGEIKEDHVKDLCSVQIIRASQQYPPFGSVGNIEYDFAAVPIGSENRFVWADPKLARDPVEDFADQ